MGLPRAVRRTGPPLRAAFQPMPVGDRLAGRSVGRQGFAKLVQGECNEACFNCRAAAKVMQSLCKVSAMKLALIAEPPPRLCKGRY